MRIGVIGCGNIAHELSKRFKISAVYDICPQRCNDIDAFLCEDIGSLITHSDIIIEAASPQAVKDYALRIIDSGRDLVIMSIGGLVEQGFRERLFTLAKEKGTHIYLPSGAIGGIDLIKTAKIAGLHRVTLRSTKNAKTLGYDVKEKTLIFKGKASQAIEKFPKSVNVSVLLSIVSGMDIDVEVYADPDIKENMHEIVVEGEFGKAEFKIINRASPANPRTSYLAVLSPLYLLENLEDVVKIGV